MQKVTKDKILLELSLEEATLLKIIIEDELKMYKQFMIDESHKDITLRQAFEALNSLCTKLDERATA